MKLVEPDIEAIYYVANHLRPQDDLEARLGWAMEGAAAVLTSAADSQILTVIEGDEGEPIGVAGCVENRIWMMGTEGLTATKSHRLQLCSLGRRWVNHCLKRLDMPIGNHVYAKNRRSIRWLRHLGFQVESPRPFGPSCALFCPFWRTP